MSTCAAIEQGLIPFRRSVLLVGAAPVAGVQRLLIDYLLLPNGVRGEVRSVRAWVDSADTAMDPAVGFELALSTPTAQPPSVATGELRGQAVAEGLITATGPSGIVVKDSNTLAIEYELGEATRQFIDGLRLYAFTPTTLAVAVGAQMRIRVVVAGWQVAPGWQADP